MKKPVIQMNDLCELTPEWLRERGISAVLSDLDNTLAGYGANVPDNAVQEWIDIITAEGIQLMIVSNAREERVAAFCKPLGLRWLAKAGKPRARAVKTAVKMLQKEPQEVLMAGDQFFTDILAARNAGVQAVLVNPRVKGFWFSLRRTLEIPFIECVRSR